MKILIILLANFILYFKTLRLSYVSDDIPTHKDPPSTKSRWERLFYWVIGRYKWKPRNDHALTMLVHALVSVFIYLAFGSNNISFWAALLFAANPANNQGSVWISGRGYALPALMLLISLSMPILAPFCLWGMGYFNIGFVAPLALVGSNKAYLLALMPFVWWYWRKKFKKDLLEKAQVEAEAEDAKIHLRKLVLAIKTMGFYLALGLIPFRITFYHSFLQSCAGNEIMRRRAYTMKDKFFWIGVFAIGVWLYLVCRGWTITTYGLLWFFITIAPFSNFRRVQQETAERYLYIPNIGLMVALASLIYTYPVLVAVFLTMYIVRLKTLLVMYKDDFWIVESACYEDPMAWYAWHIRGFKRWDNQSYKEALTMWVMAKLISPKEFKVLFNIAIVLKLLGKHQEGEEYFKAAQANIVEGQEKKVEGIMEDFKQGKGHLLM